MLPSWDMRTPKFKSLHIYCVTFYTNMSTNLQFSYPLVIRCCDFICSVPITDSLPLGPPVETSWVEVSLFVRLAGLCGFRKSNGEVPSIIFQNLPASSLGNSLFLSGLFWRFGSNPSGSFPVKSKELPEGFKLKSGTISWLENSVLSSCLPESCRDVVISWVNFSCQWSSCHIFNKISCHIANTFLPSCHNFQHLLFGLAKAKL